MILSEIMDEYEKELIVEISKSVKGIGPGKAGTISENFDDYREFRNATDSEFREIITRKGKRILSDE